MIHESTIIELCYLLSIDLGVRISYGRVYGDESDKIFGQLKLDGEFIDSCWEVDSNTSGGEMIVNSDRFNGMKEEILNHLKSVV